MALRFDNVGFGWNGSPPLMESFDLRVHRGQTVSVVGHSGCGKSTLLRLAAGLIAPSDGTVTREAGEVGFVFQSATLLPWKSVMQNVTLPLELGGVGSEESEARGRAVLESVGLGAVLDALPNTLSGGMQMRVSLARALVTRPKLMLLDEPFGSLDAITRHRVMDLFCQIREEVGFSSLLVTHDIDEAVLLSDEVVVVGDSPLQTRARFQVDLSHPRDSTMRFDPALARLTAEIERAL